jgi:hypothetical protein
LVTLLQWGVCISGSLKIDVGQSDVVHVKIFIFRKIERVYCPHIYGDLRIMANTTKYTDKLKEANPDAFMIGDTNTEATTQQGVSTLFDYVTKKTSIINSSGTLEDKNAFYIVSTNCALTLPVGYEGITIGVKVTSVPTTVTIVPTSPNSIEGGNPSLTASDIREYCFASGVWYRIR